MAQKAIGPKLEPTIAEFYPKIFSNLHSGTTFVLEIFPTLYRRTLYDLKGLLTKGELSLLVDVFNGALLTPGLVGQHIIAQVEDGIDLDGLDKKWEIEKTALVEKLKSLPLFSLACLEIWANGFWYRKEKPEGLNFDAWVEQLLVQQTA